MLSREYLLATTIPTGQSRLAHLVHLAPPRTHPHALPAHAPSPPLSFYLPLGRFKEQIYDVFKYMPETVQCTIFSATMPLEVRALPWPWPSRPLSRPYLAPI